MKRAVFLMLFAICTSLTVGACGGVSSPTGTTCGPAPPEAPPLAFLAYPISGTSSVSISVGQVIVAGNPALPDAISLISGSATVSGGGFAAAASPLPTPYATPSGGGGNIPYVAVPIPTLSPSTTYTVNFSYPDWADNPPSCKTTVTQQLGTFTTQ